MDIFARMLKHSTTKAYRETNFVVIANFSLRVAGRLYYHGLRKVSYHFLTPFLSTISKTIGWRFGCALEILNAFDIRLRASVRTSSRSV